MISELANKQTKISVIGLGYVGLPIALAFARKYQVVGFDINPERVKMMKEQKDPSNELPSSAFHDCDIVFTSDAEDLKAAHFHIVAVPTPLGDYKLPDLTPLKKASAMVGNILKKGDYVVFESTVYPGCTEEECVPILEETSGLSYQQDFKVGYSPERINPGDTEHTLTTIKKVTSGCDEESSEVIGQVYGSIIDAGIHQASSIRVAEAAKVIENTQRDINIAFMNELSIIFSRMGINTYDVLEAAGTKWNFLNFFPGLVGGHCIGVDPYYLSFKAMNMGYHPQMITAGRFVNDSMGGYIAKQTVKRIVAKGQNIQEAQVLIMGATFKENVSDIRNTRVVDIIKELRSYAVEIDVMDPYASGKEMNEEYGISLTENPSGKYDAIILAVSHREYQDLDESYFRSLSKEQAVFVDVKGIYNGKIHYMDYWSL